MSRKLVSVVRPAAQGDCIGHLDHSKEAKRTGLFQLKNPSLWLPGQGRSSVLVGRGLGGFAIIQGRSSGLDSDVRVCSCLGGGDGERNVDASEVSGLNSQGD